MRTRPGLAVASLCVVAMLSGVAGAQVRPGGNGPLPGDPGYPGQGSGNSGQGPYPSGYWETTWGAIAANGPKGILGDARGRRSKEEAAQAAIADCRANGGGSACKLELAYYNQCAVLVTGVHYYIVQSAATIDEAARLGIGKCSLNDTNCRVFHSACTEPIYHPY